MRQLKSVYLCLFALLSLGGCAGGSKYQDIQASMTNTANQGRIYFLRNSSFVGAEIKPAIILDGDEVGQSLPGDFFYVDAPPGSHQVSTGGAAQDLVTFVLAAGEAKYVKTGVGFGAASGRVVPEVIGASLALQELPELSLGGGHTRVVHTNAGTLAPPVATTGARPEALPEPEIPVTTEVIPVPGLAPDASMPPAQPPAATPVAAPRPEAPAPTPQGSPAPAAQAISDTPALPAAATGKIQLGQSSTTVETLAHEEKNCIAEHGAELLRSNGPSETYREQCRDGRILIAVCEFRQCRLQGN